MKTNILLAGDGGQGIQTISDILTRAIFKSGLNVSEIPNYGLEQRGGVSLSFLRVQHEDVVYPKFSKANLILLMSNQARERTGQYIDKNTDIIDIDKYSELESLNKKSINIFFLGILAKKLEEKNVLEVKKVKELLKNTLSKKPFWKENQEAFKKGINN